MKLLDRFCKWYMSRKQKATQMEQKGVQDKKLKEAVDKLKALYEFVKFINEKCVRNRHERKTFWRNVAEGRPLVEETILNVLRRMGATEESIKSVMDMKVKAQEQINDQKTKRRMAKESAIGCPADCSADCSKCANKPQSSEVKKDENKT